MFNIFSRSINTATRFDTQDAPDHWRRQHQDYINRREAKQDRAARLHAVLEESRF